MAIAIAGTIFSIAENSRFKDLAEQHQLNIPLDVREKMKSLLSAPEKLYAYFSDQAPVVQQKLVTVFKTSFLHGFHAGMVVATVVSFVCMVAIFSLLSKKK